MIPVNVCLRGRLLFTYQLRDFAVAHDNAELLQLILKSQTIVEKLQCTSHTFNIQSRITLFSQVEHLPQSISLDH